MRRIFLMALAASALSLAAPGIASAHHGKSRHHARHSRRSHHARLVRFGTLPSSSVSGGAPQAGAPTTPATPTNETAGTVKEFTEGVLTILLSDGKTLVSGKVTERTEIHCQPAAPTEGDDNDDQQGDNSGGDSHSGSSVQGDQVTGSGDDDNGGGDDEHGGQANCTTAALVPGAVVREAELSVGSGGAVWDQIDLIQ
jgi:hypothetical protein